MSNPTDAACVPLATGSRRSDKIRAVAQQAHDNGDCVCCLPDEMVEFDRMTALKEETEDE